MDTLTHALTGATLSALVFKRIDPTIALVSLTLSSVLPDIDYISRLDGMVSYLKYHRGPTHSFIGLIIGSLILASLIKLFSKGTNFGTLLFLCLAGSFVHVFMDLTNSYGTQVLWPFTQKRFGWDWVPIIDPYIFFPLLVGIFFALFWRTYSFKVSVVALLFIASYVGVRGYTHHLAYNITKNYKLEDQKKLKFGAFAQVYPFSPFRWSSVIETKDHYLTGEINLLDRGNPNFIRHPKLTENEFVEIAKNTKTGKVFLNFSPYPRLQINKSNSNWIISWDDLRFSFFNTRRFVAQVTISEDRRVLSESFKF